MIKIRAERSFSSDSYNIWIFDYRDRKCFAVKPTQLEFIEINPGHLLPEPSFSIDHFLSSELFPELQKSLAGLTFPGKEDFKRSDKIEQLMQSHIEDLRNVINKICLK